MTAVAPKVVVEVESEEDRELKDELKLLVERISDKDVKLIPPALEIMKNLIKTSTTSMTSVPKPLKYLAPYYATLKNVHAQIKDPNIKKALADIISVLALGTSGGDEARKNQDCLKYCLVGTMRDIGGWGHEYIRQLETEIIQQWSCEKGTQILMPLVKDVLEFDCTHHAEIQACDLLMEIDQLILISDYINLENYERVCLYLNSCTKYVDVLEAGKIMSLVTDQYLKFNEYAKALISAIQMKNNDLINDIFNKCKDKVILFQLAFICARHLHQATINPDMEHAEDISSIMGNNNLTSHFLSFARELDIMEPKAPEDVYKTWLEPTPPFLSLLGDNVDSARQNLATSFVNGFVNAAFGCDKLLTTDNNNKWIHRNKDHAMMSATASLGMLHLWDVDGGLTPIDKYLYSTEDFIKSGALLALGIVNCRVKNECDPALALLSDYINSNNAVYQTGAILGIGLAYAGTARDDILNLLAPVIQSTTSPEILGITSISCGLIALGRSEHSIITAILSKIIEANGQEQLKSHYMRLAGLGVALCYFGCTDQIDVPNAAMDVFEEPYKTMIQTMLQMCAYAGTGDVLVVQELLRLVEERIAPNKNEKSKDKGKKSDPLGHKRKDRKSPPEWDNCIGQAMAVIAVAAVSKGEDIGADMIQRIFGHIGRYGERVVRKAVPLAIALTSVSNPQLQVVDILTKYSHDSDDDVACNAIFGLGFVGAGTNNARLAAGLRQMAVFHTKNPSQLFMVRLAQGLLHLGKGTMTLSPLHTDRMLVDPVAMAGLLITLVSLIDPHSLILGKSHYLLYTLVTAIHPRWLITLDEDLQPLSVTVRVGQAVDTVGKAGTPKTIAGIHTHSTPVLLGANERAELVSDEYKLFSPTLDGVCVLKKIAKS